MDNDFFKFKSSGLEWSYKNTANGILWTANMKHDIKIFLIEDSSAKWQWMTRVAEHTSYSNAHAEFDCQSDAYIDALENIIKENL